MPKKIIKKEMPKKQINPTVPSLRLEYYIQLNFAREHQAFLCYIDLLFLFQQPTCYKGNCRKSLPPYISFFR